MSGSFWILITLMLLLAFGFISAPLFRHKNRVGPVGVATALPIISIGLYLIVGSPPAAGVDSISHRPLQTRASASRSNPAAVGSVASMIDGLAARLKDNPDDAKGWLLLARSYKHLRRVPEAGDAYERAAALGEYDDELAALARTPGPESMAGARISGVLKLSQRAQALVEPTDTVFIFARAVGGPAMPVAVLRRPASDLPLNFSLNDSQAMSAEAKLSNHEQVVVVARVSRSGIASDALKDLEAKSEALAVAENSHLDLTIE